MTTSNYFSDVVVEIAFDSGFGTPAASRTWTDVSQWVELAQGISISYGRQDERAQADANTLSLTLDNSDGRFTPGRASSPYYPNVKLYRPIRVTATPPSGAASVRFTGYINQWPVSWEGSDGRAMSQIAASSRLSRLGLSETFLSIIEETASLPAMPRAYFTLGDPAGARYAANSAEPTTFPLAVRGSAPDVVFGTATGPGTDGLTAATFLGGQYLRGAQVDLVPSTWTGITLSAFYSRNGTVTEFQNLIKLTTVSDSQQVRIGTQPTGAISSAGPNIALGVFDDLGDDLVHHIALRFDPAGAAPTVKVYIDGVYATNNSPIYTTGSAFDVLEVGDELVGSLSHVTVWDTALDEADIQAIAAAGVTGFDAETSDARFRRYASWAGIPDAELVTSGLTRTVTSTDTTAQDVVGLMRQLETTESAVLYDDRAGNLTLVSESTRYAATSAFTLDMKLQQVEADFAPQFDAGNILNDVTAAHASGSPAARVVDADSKDDYGVGSTTTDTLSTNDDDPRYMAEWLVATYAQPRSRVPSVAVDITAQAGATPSPSTLMAADIGTMFTIVNQPAQADASTGSYFVEGYAETFGPESHEIAFNVSPAAPFTSAWVLDDPVRGLIDSDNVLAL